ncbi:MAG: hypothetical protein WA666_04695 [Nitrospirota bacterium]
MLKKLALLLSASLFLILIACASAHSTEKNAGVKAAPGAMCGCLAGSGVGKCVSEQTEAETDAASRARYVYKENAPVFIHLYEIKISPRRVPPGGRAEIIATYTVLGKPGTKVDVVELREFMRSGKVLGSPRTEIKRGGGTYISRVPVVFPTTAGRGTYRMRVTIKSGASGAAKETSFIID